MQRISRSRDMRDGGSRCSTRLAIRVHDIVAQAPEWAHGALAAAIAVAFFAFAGWIDGNPPW